MPEFVGRTEQLERMDAVLKEVSQEKGKTLFLYGDTGTGKFALVEHFVEEKDLLFFSYGFRHRERRPFSCVLPVLQDIKKSGCASPQLERALGLLSTDGSTRGGRDSLLGDLSQGIVSCASKPMVILLDNMHWADGESISFLETFSRDIVSSPILLVVTYTNEGLAERDGGMHPLMEAMGRLMEDDLFQAMELGPLSPHETEELLSLQLGGKSPPKRLVVTIYSATKGNPLFIKEMMEDLLKKKSIDLSDPDWASKLRVDGLSLPTSLREAAKSSISELDEEETDILEVMSLLGESFEEKSASRILGIQEEEMFDSLLSLVEKRLVDRETGKFSLHHSFIVSIVKGSMKKQKKIDLSRKIALFLKESGENLLAGFHAMEGEMWEEAAELLCNAASEAHKSYAFQTGKDAASKCLDCSLKAGREDIAYRASLLLGILYYDMGDWNEAQPLLAQASTSSDSLAREAFLFLAHMSRNRSQWGESMEHYRKVLELGDENSSTVADAYRGMGKIAWRQGELDRAMEYMEKAAAISEKIGDNGILGSVCIDLGNVNHNMGKSEVAVSSHTRGVELLTPLEAWGEVARAYNNMGEVYKESGNIETAVECYEKSIEMAEKGREKRTRGYALGNAAECYARLGRVKKARPMADEATAYFKKIGEEYVVASSQMIYGIIASKEGDWEEASRRFEQGAASLELLGIKYDLAILLLEYGRTLMKKGDAEAVSNAKNILEKARENAISINATSLVSSIDEELNKGGG